MSTSAEMYKLAFKELKHFLEEGQSRWHGYVSPVHLLLGVAGSGLSAVVMYRRLRNREQSKR